MNQKNQFENCPEGLPRLTPRGRIIGILRLRQQAGFTLIEILMAMTIFTTSFLALAAGATTVMKSNHSSYNDTIATTLVQDKLEELMAGAALPACANFAACTDTPTTSSSVTFNRSWRIIAGQPVAGVTQIDVQLIWNDPIQHNLIVASAVDL